MFKSILSVIALVALVGCASHPEIKIPATSRVIADQWAAKTFRLELLYSQPRPGVFSGGEQLALTPLKDAELSVASANILRDFPTLIANHLPAGTKVTEDGEGDYQLRVALVAYDKLGPTYKDYEFMKSMGKALLTFGLAADEIDIIANFEIEYTLSSQGGNSFTKKFVVKESIDNEKGGYEFRDISHDLAAQLLHKHITLTTSAFFAEAKGKL